MVGPTACIDQLFFETPCINQLDTGYLIYNYREDKKLVNIINYT